MLQRVPDLVQQSSADELEAALHDNLATAELRPIAIKTDDHVKKLG